MALRPIPVLALAAAGGSVGALARYGAGEALPHALGAWPWATFIVNVVGCLAAGVVLALVNGRSSTPEWVRPLLVGGVLGGFTTFSAVAAEVHDMVETDRAALALIYVVASLVLGLMAVALGRLGARRWLP